MNRGPNEGSAFSRVRGPNILRYEEVEEPVPGAGEVRIRVAATSFNPVDGGIRGGYLQGPFPVEEHGVAVSDELRGGE